MKIILIVFLLALANSCYSFGLGKYCESQCKEQITNCFSLPICYKGFTTCFPKSKIVRGDTFLVEFRILSQCLEKFMEKEQSNSIKELLTCAKMCGFTEKFVGNDQYEDFNESDKKNIMS